MQATPLSKLQQGLGVRVKDFRTKKGGVKQNFGVVEHFIRGVRVIPGWGGGGLATPNPSGNPPMARKIVIENPR